MLNGLPTDRFTQADIASGSVAFAHSKEGSRDTGHDEAIGFKFTITHQGVEHTEQEFSISVSNLTMTGAVVQKVKIHC